MAKMIVTDDSKIYRITKWSGVNQSSEGDTDLPLGMAADMRNFRITKDGSLQIRPGYASKCVLGNSPIRGMWHGYVGGKYVWLVSCGGHVYSIDLETYGETEIGAIADAQTTFFPFSNKVYILDGNGYYCWDGTAFGEVEGYVPLVATATPPSGGGTLLEQVNKLTGSKRQKFSPDGNAKDFQLLETDITSVDWVKINGVVQTPTTHYTFNLTTGKITFVDAPPAGTNTVEIQWTKGTGDRETITKQRFAEMYSGYTDNRVFLYGDGTNKAYYSGLDEHGQPSAEYFPDLNVLNVGEENTPITSMIRHFAKLMVFKTDSAHLIHYDVITLEDGTVTAGFYVRNIDKDTGNVAPGQVRLINNYPVSLHGNSVYRWSLLYSSGVQDERAASRISDRVRETLSGMNLTNAVTFDDEWNREFWIVQNGTACIYQYANEAQGGASYKNNLWFIYTNISATCFASIDGELYCGTTDGRILHISRKYRNDDGEPIDAYWESGSMYFDADYTRKFSSDIWIAMEPESQARIVVTAQSNVNSNYSEETVASGLATFTHMDFSHFSFGVNRKPQTYHIKLKVKKFVYYKLIFSLNSASATATILAADIRVRTAGTVK